MKDTNDNLENIDQKNHIQFEKLKLASCSRDLIIISRLLADITNHGYAVETKAGVRVWQCLDAD